MCYWTEMAKQRFAISVLQNSRTTHSSPQEMYKLALPHTWLQRCLRQVMWMRNAMFFSFAVLLWECITGKTPWESYTSPMQIIFAVGVQRVRPDIPADTPVMLCELIKDCWEHSPAKRPSFTQVLDRIQDELRCLGVETVPRSNVNVQALGLDVPPTPPAAEDMALIPESS
mmetsp:Transcript_7775/g.48220  ORF Transcript_7775/g.48220 Transcript_7775/m.48220 type:complete len:171 (-) Transcript_7775:431-943(-)